MKIKSSVLEIPLLSQRTLACFYFLFFQYDLRCLVSIRQLLICRNHLFSLYIIFLGFVVRMNAKKIGFLQLGCHISVFFNDNYEIEFSKIHKISSNYVSRGRCCFKDRIYEVTFHAIVEKVQNPVWR